MSLDSGVGKRKLKLGVKIFIILLVIGGLFGGIYFVVNNIFNNPYKVYTGFIDNVHNKIVSYLDKSHDEKISFDKDEIMRGDLNLKVQSSIPELKPYADYKYGMNIIVDPKNEKMEEVFSISDYKTEKKIFDIGFYLGKETMFLQSKYMYNETLDFSDFLDNSSEISSMFADFREDLDVLDTQDLEYLVTSIRDSVVDAIDKKALKSKFDKIKINGKDVRVVRFDYELDKKVLNEVYDKIADSLLDNSKGITIISKIFGIAPTDVEKSLNEGRNSFTKADSFTISIYKKVFSSEIVKFSLVTADEFEINYFDKNILMTYQKYEIKIDMSDKITTFTYTQDKEELINLKIKEIGFNIIDLTYELNVENSLVSGEIYLKSKKKSDTSVFLEYSFSLLTNVDGENVNLRVFGDMAVSIVNKMNLIDKETVIPITNLDESTIINIYSKGYNSLKDTPFIPLYDSLF